MNDTQRKQTAIAFVALHKEMNLDNWLPNVVDVDAKLLKIYDNLADGIYGMVYNNGDSCTVEIGSHESATGRPELFEWWLQ